MLVLDDGLYQQNPEPLQLGKLKLSAVNTLRIGDSVSQLSGVLIVSRFVSPGITWV